MLDADTWVEKEAIPINIGRRFFRVRGDDQPLPEADEVNKRSFFHVRTCFLLDALNV